jgi:integrase/recombinase XerD
VTRLVSLPEPERSHRFHTFRATGITAYLEGGGTIAHAQQIANHESLKTTKLYDRTSDQIDLDELEKIRI